jgi:tetratricopeptide (TPR) repeat protein
MSKMHRCLCLFLLAVVAVAALPARAWDGRGQRAIAAMAMQVVKNDYGYAFKPGDLNFEQDVLRGATDGWKVLEGTVPLGNDAETVQAVATEIQLLRDIRNYGITPYFAYRMGVLSALVADVMLPYGFAWSEQDQAIKRQMERDIAANLDKYGFTVTQRQREFIRAPKDYFTSRRAFVADDRRIIANDYRGGKGYNGFLKDGGPAYFSRAVEAVADAWHTVLRREGDPSVLSASRRALTWYFVDETAYLLQEKRDLPLARAAYANFEKVNPGLPEAYEKLGDLYYAFGTPDAIVAAVREWRNAFDLGGPERNRVGAKLAGHFMREGKRYLERARSPQAEKNDLENALRNFETQLEYERTSQEAAALIQETNVEIKERNARFELTLNIIANAEAVVQDAERQKLKGDYAYAINTYDQAITLYEAVGDEFKDQFKLAQDTIAQLKRTINDTVGEVIDKASDVIDEGTRKREENRYPEAVAEFDKVPVILAQIPEPNPDDPNARRPVSQERLEEKRQIIELAASKKDEAKKAQIRFEAAAAAAAEGGRRPGAGGAPGAGAPGAGAPAPGAGVRPGAGAPQ